MARSGFATSLKPLGCFVPWTLLARRSASAPASAVAGVHCQVVVQQGVEKSSTMSPSPRSSSKEGQNVPPSGRRASKRRVSRAPPPWRLGVRPIAPSLASPRSGGGYTCAPAPNGLSNLFDREKEFFPTLARSRQDLRSFGERAARRSFFLLGSSGRDVQASSTPRALGKTLAAGATTGRAREAIFGGETFRVFTSTRGALRPSRGTSSGTSAGSGGRRGRVPAFPISSVTSVDVPSRRPRRATATRWPPREPPWRTPPYLRSRSPA